MKYLFLTFVSWFSLAAAGFCAEESCVGTDDVIVKSSGDQGDSGFMDGFYMVSATSDNRITLSSQCRKIIGTGVTTNIDGDSQIAIIAALNKALEWGKTCREQKIEVLQPKNILRRSNGDKDYIAINFVAESGSEVGNNPAAIITHHQSETNYNSFRVGIDYIPTLIRYLQAAPQALVDFKAHEKSNEEKVNQLLK